MTRERARRASPGYTYDPCPVCKGKRQGSVQYGDDPPLLSQRRKDSPCNSCVHLMEEAEAIVAQGEEQKRRKDEMTIPLGVRPYVYLRQDFDMRDEQKAVTEALTSVARAVGMKPGKERAVRPIVTRSSDHMGAYAEQRLFSQEQVDAFTTLANAVVATVDHAYQHGYEDGADLLRRLAAGDVTVFDYDAERARVKP